MDWLHLLAFTARYHIYLITIVIVSPTAIWAFCRLAENYSHPEMVDGRPAKPGQGQALP
jgi:hypothetical protein